MQREEREVQYRGRGWWADDTLARWLARHVRERPDAPALALQDIVLSWRDVEQRVLLVAAGLRARGVASGDVVALQLPNTPDFVLSYLAIARLGAVTCTLHMPYRGAEVQARAEALREGTLEMDAATVGAHAAEAELAKLVADRGLGSLGGGGEEAERFDVQIRA